MVLPFPRAKSPLPPGSLSPPGVSSSASSGVTSTLALTSLAVAVTAVSVTLFATDAVYVIVHDAKAGDSVTPLSDSALRLASAEPSLVKVTVGPRWARRAARRPPAPLRTLLLMTSVSATQRRPRPGRRNSTPHSLDFTPRTDTPRSIVAHRTRDGPNGCRGLIGRRSSVGHGPAAAEKRGPRKPSAESMAYTAAMRGEREAKRRRTPRRDPNAGVRESGLW